MGKECTGILKGAYQVFQLGYATPETEEWLVLYHPSNDSGVARCAHIRILWRW